jgi:hypothetical protein
VVVPVTLGLRRRPGAVRRTAPGAVPERHGLLRHASQGGASGGTSRRCENVAGLAPCLRARPLERTWCQSIISFPFGMEVEFETRHFEDECSSQVINTEERWWLCVCLLLLQDLYAQRLSALAPRAHIPAVVETRRRRSSWRRSPRYTPVVPSYVFMHNHPKMSASLPVADPARVHSQSRREFGRPQSAGLLPSAF